MAKKGNYKSAEFARDYKDDFYSDMGFVEHESSSAKLSDFEYAFGKMYYTRFFTWLHEEFSSGEHTGKRLLEIGCGPGILSAISASKVFDEIILSDISEHNLNEIQKWLKSSPGSFDWTPALSFVGKLEGNQLTAEQVAKRVRKALKDTLLYDINDDLPPQEGFDCLISVLVLGTASKDLTDFQRNLCKLASVLKGPGATAIITLITGESEDYTVGDKDYHTLNISREMALSGLSKAGFACMNVTEYVPPSDPAADQSLKHLFISAKLSVGKHS